MNLQSYNHKSYEAYETFGFIRLFFFTFLSDYRSTEVDRLTNDLFRGVP